MTCVNTAAFFESPNFWELANAELDRLPKEYVAEVHAKFLNEVYLTKGSTYDFGTLNALNAGGTAKQSGSQSRLDESYIQKYRDTVQKFYGET
jgi:hypothetical protein